MIIRDLVESDYPAVREIYEHGIQSKQATFETTSKDWEQWNQQTFPKARLVLEHQATIIGWAVLSPVSSRCVYEGVCEVSVYVHKDHWRKGYGKRLLKALIAASEDANIWTLTASIFPENQASVHIHESLGFEYMGLRRRIGKMDGVWRDTVILERRSEVAGMD